MVNKLHLGKGSQIPVLPEDGKLRLYSMQFCPYAQRARLVLEAKNIPYHTININLKYKPEWLTERSPLGKVPALEIPSAKGDPLIESLVVAEYLDEAYPENPLRSSDPLQRARDKILIERFGGFIQTAFYQIFFPKGSLDDVSKILEEMNTSLDIFETELKNRGTKFFSGSKAGFVDYMIWPWFERAEAFSLILAEKYEGMDKDRFSKLFEWKESMKQDQAVQAILISGENHYKFRQSYLTTENPDFDFLA